MEKALAVHAVPVGALVPMLQQLESDKTDTTAGATAAADVCGDGYMVTLDGVPVMGYVLRFADGAKPVCWVLGAVGHAPGHDLTAEVLPVIERQAREGGAQQVAFTTKRRGLEKKISMAGYVETGRIYRKNIV